MKTYNVKYEAYNINTFHKYKGNSNIKAENEKELLKLIKSNGITQIKIIAITEVLK